MKTTPDPHRLSILLITAILGILFCPAGARAVTTVFFNSSQTTNLVSSGTTSDTISSEGYLFTFTRDKLFTGGTGNPIGRSVRVPWPDGLEAQAVTAGPNLGGGRMTITRQDGQVFAISSFTLKLLGNTGGAGGAFEIMPLLNGQDGVPDPFAYDATGYYGQNFTYATPELTGFDTYKIGIYVDFALMSLTVVDASVPPPSLDILQLDPVTVQLSWPAIATGYQLESATTLPPTTWSPVTNAVTPIGDLFTVQLDLAGSQQFFRLRK